MRLTPLLLLSLLTLSCYTRLNHPQLRDESRLFTPDPASDCRACHASEPWLLEQELGGYPSPPLADEDHWTSFRSQPWWFSAAVALPAGGPALTPAGQAAPTPPPDRPLVMGPPTGHRHDTVADPDSSAGGKDRPSPTPRPRKRNRKPVSPAQPAPADTSRKGS